MGNCKLDITFCVIWYKPGGQVPSKVAKYTCKLIRGVQAPFIKASPMASLCKVK